MTNGTKKEEIYSLPTPDRQTFDIYTKKPRIDKYQNYLQK